VLGACQTRVTTTPTGSIEMAADSTLHFSPTKVTFTRFASACGVTNPPFTDADVFSLVIVGAGSFPAGATAIELTTSLKVPLDQKLSFMLGPFGLQGSTTDASGHTFDRFGQSGQIPADQLSFQWMQGADPSEIDSMALSSVTVDFAAFPSKDGEPLDAQMAMTFVDGGLLDFSTHSTVVSALEGCPAG
jgi:hypothetical protein